MYDTNDRSVRCPIIIPPSPSYGNPPAFHESGLPELWWPRSNLCAAIYHSHHTASMIT